MLPFAAGVASALMLTVLGAFPARAASPSFFNPNGADSPPTNSSPTASSKAGPAKEVSMGGGGTLTDVPHGPCSRTTCNASAGDCECLTFTGKMNGRGFGKVSVVMALTINDDDKTPTGAYGGFCFPSAGTATLTGKKWNVVVLAVTGLSCNFFPPSTYGSGQLQLSYTEDSQFGGSGKFATAIGAGNLNVGIIRNGMQASPAVANIAGVQQLQP